MSARIPARVLAAINARRQLPVLSEREAALQLRPLGQRILVEAASAPVNHSRPFTAGDQAGRESSQLLERAGDST